MEEKLFYYLIGLEQYLHRSEVRTNADKVAALLSPTFQEFGSSGNAWSRSEILERLAGEDGMTKIDAYNFKASRLSDEVFLLTYTSKHLPPAGQHKEFLRSSIWKYTNGQWHMEFHQGTQKAPIS